VGSGVEDLGGQVEIEEGSRWGLYAHSSMEYCTHWEVEHFESEGMRQLMEARTCWYSSRKVTERTASLAATADLEIAVAACLEGENIAAGLQASPGANMALEASNTVAVVAP
jgi:hypothetical protein